MAIFEKIQGRQCCNILLAMCTRSKLTHQSTYRQSAAITGIWNHVINHYMWGFGKVLKTYVLMHIAFAIPRKLTIRNIAFLGHYSCRWYCVEMFSLFIQTGTITRVLEERSWWWYILYISGPERQLNVHVCMEYLHKIGVWDSWVYSRYIYS